MGGFAVITTYSNYMKWEKRREQAQKFIKSWENNVFPVFVMECAYEGRPFELHSSEYNVNIVHLRANTPLWHQYNLINVAIEKLKNFDRFLWVDIDITFEKSNMFVCQKTYDALYDIPFFQPWRFCVDDTDHSIGESFCSRFFRGLPIIQGPNAPKNWKNTYGLAQCGYSWAITRDCWKRFGGLVDFGLLGSSDAVMVFSLLGKGKESLMPGLSPSIMDKISIWEKNSEFWLKESKRSTNYLDNVIYHSFHGKSENRRYEDRYEIFVKHQVDIDVDAYKNEDGLWEIKTDKVELIDDIKDYFSSRKEDENA